MLFEESFTAGWIVALSTWVVLEEWQLCQLNGKNFPASCDSWLLSFWGTCQKMNLLCLYQWMKGRSAHRGIVLLIFLVPRLGKCTVTQFFTGCPLERLWPIYVCIKTKQTNFEAVFDPEFSWFHSLEGPVWVYSYLFPVGRKKLIAREEKILPLPEVKSLLQNVLK